ncbi:MAG: ABC transporter permease [Bradymonadales bacterium]|nr:ABC transporter permease [Bradymonadales bacterium]
MVFEDFVGIRYLMAKRDRNMLSVITLISVGGVAVGVMALIVVLSVMGGFEADFREKITGSKAHVVISAKDGYIENYEEIRAIALKTDRVEGANGYVEAEVMLNSPTNLQAAILRGIDYREIVTTTKLGDYIEEGKLEYLEDPDALPSISMVGSVVQRGTLSIQSDTEDGGLTDEKVDRLEQAGARAAIAFAGDKHGAWIAKGSQEIELPAGVETAPETVVGDANSPQNAEHNADDLTKNGDIYDLPDVDPIAPMPRRRSAADVGNNATDGDLSPELLAAIGEDRWVDSESSPTVRQPAAMGDAQAGATQYDREPNAVLLPQNKRTRTMKAMPGLDGSDSSRRVGAIILGRELKNNLTLYLGGELNIMSPSGDIGPAGNLPKSRPFKVVGSYYSGMFEYDAKMAYISLADAQAFLGIGNAVTGIDVKCSRLEDSKRVRDALREKLKDYPNVQVDDWLTLNSSLFGAIMLEKVAMFVILTSIILVASFNILCLLIMMVIEKAREIAIFKAMGARDSSIVRMFVVQGAIIGGLGTAIGLILGLGLCVIIAQLGIKMPGNVHYITQIPVMVNAVEVIVICAASIAISLLATVLPSRMAVKLDPVSGLRCE